MLRRWVQFAAVYLALGSQVLLPLAQWIHQRTADAAGGVCTICNPGGNPGVTCPATAAIANRAPAAAGRELLFDVAGGSAPSLLPTQSSAHSLRTTLQLAMARARQNGQPVQPPVHDPANCLICVQLAQCRSADRPPVPVALPTPAPAIAQVTVTIVARSQLALIPLPPARAPPVSL